MLSYQHGFHAGNRADVLKHAVLDLILRDAARGARPVLYVETHSGRGRYDLTGPQARKGGEADTGVLALLKGGAPAGFDDWLSLVRARGETDYPGSPALALARLPASARAVLFERHPAEFKALSGNVGADPRVLVREADGYAGALRLAPRGHEQIIVFSDPSYETRRDIEALALWTPKALKRWPTGMILLWLPLFRDGREAEFGELLAELGANLIAGSRWPVAPAETSSLEGTALVGFRVPGAAAKAAEAMAKDLESLWARGT
ncbi:MAG: 23S rRNA (adenine(2030)-N(6))-methyltransferase RlmJ [Hyphomonas sp.]|uniref:23S rRNA (adenine(2030)-N(6))-methyltransferase RlmJ n=1 Tax=Hyphomonas sp. TaxID=87 RepID=UPI0017C47D2F|nr:23S rRNA (adenine(2030)-N(6))-methyltransferase RlmJ [Hyphomonas sp.]MBA3067476.1 23S rRNA (adenine(2030)-N(6))-methyltransferase RlmJ [Hyphomonas sp.]MBU3921819.1 23S rRNA (adenine(2030)-N(6))-methyltransferase RlmJ [Alphaproteobacteria bacterium]MBU4063364.1 23S rRNA (adenine(2030)-N(6))-methyltransferase RlmJ [Alphaproteobacteria bacterium]MBU4165184.1 23S rRNA (adenine(2030)-N(6))-methyltransferase RlmJ [Alphaproteobacteria bacterium]